MEKNVTQVKESRVLERAEANPILKPRANKGWESSCVFNPAALYLGGKVHLFYRAMGSSGVSTIGYASSKDGVHIDSRSCEPVYRCCVRYPENAHTTSSLLTYSSGGSSVGCEDPRLVCIDDTIYMTYTAFDHWCVPPSVALTSIARDDFLQSHWNFKAPVLISPKGEMHKNWVIFPAKIRGKFAILHSLSPEISIAYLDSLDFKSDTPPISSYYSVCGRENYWDTSVRGVGPPPIKTTAGWLVLYHAMDAKDPNRYKIGAMILDAQHPERVLYRTAAPLLAPDFAYENEGFKSSVVYACGMVIKDDRLFVYYGGADTVVCVASLCLEKLLAHIKASGTQN